MRWVGHVESMVEKIGVYRVVKGKPEGKRPLGRPRYRWEGNIKTDIQEGWWGGVDWMNLHEAGCGAWTGSIWFRTGKVAGTCECGNEPSGSIKCGEFLDWLRTCQLLKKYSSPWSEEVSE
jgi:hypothetical protein